MPDTELDAAPVEGAATEEARAPMPLVSVEVSTGDLEVRQVAVANPPRRLTRVCEAITGEAWAITEGGLAQITAVVRRHQAGAAVPDEGEPAYLKRDYQVMAGPGAQRLPGTSRAFVIDGVAIIPITGPIFPRANMMTEMSGATSVSTLTEDYRTALSNPEIGAIILQIDSPGGAVSGINALADVVLAGQKKKYTMAYVSGAAASAAYWIASSASEIALERTGIVGSIGVVSAVPAQVAPDRDGEMVVEIVSSNAPKKRPDPLSDAGRADIVGMLDAIESQFIADVARGRRVSTDKVKSDFGQGGVRVGADAVKAGMADKVQSYESALAAMRRKVANERKLSALKGA